MHVNAHDMMNEHVTIKAVLITSRMPNMQLEHVLLLAWYACENLGHHNSPLLIKFRPRNLLTKISVDT